MSQFRNMEEGEILKIRSKPIEFSFWPTQRTSRRYGLQSNVFCSDPFSIIAAVIQSGENKEIINAALSFVQQARYMYDASQGSREPAAKPLLLYYSFMNLAKAFYLHKMGIPFIDRILHGLAAKHSKSGPIINNANLEAHGFSRGLSKGIAPDKNNIFDDFILALNGSGYPKKRMYEVAKLIPQIVTGHRIWSVSVKQNERFIGLERIEYVHNKTENEIWLRFYVYSDALSRLKLSRKRFLDRTMLVNDFHTVKCNDSIENRKLACFEQTHKCNYSHRPSDVIGKVAHDFSLRVWPVVSSIPPYRRYYVYACPTSEHDHVLPQLASMLAVTFYYGSITRYRPDDFDKLLTEKYGPFTQDFLSWIGGQFIYLLASEFFERNVTMAAVV